MTQKYDFKFSSTAEKFLGVISNTLRPGTIRNYYMSIREFMTFLESNYPELSCMSDIRRAPHINDWLMHIAGKGLAAGTRHIKVGCIQRYFEYIREWGWDDVPPAGMITSKDIPNPDNYLPKPLTPKNDRKLQDALRKDKRLLPQSLLLLRKTGMRIGELLDLEVEFLRKYPDNCYVLHVPLGKIHSERIIPVDTETADIFKHIVKLRGDAPPISNPRTGKLSKFLVVDKRNNKRPSYSNIRKHLSKIAINAGITSHVSLHMLRHTYATELIRAGISMPALMKLLGHRSIDMSMRYIEVTQEDLHVAFDNALKRVSAIPLTLTQQDARKSNPDIFGNINDAVTQLYSIRQGLPHNTDRKRLQRITERLRRICGDIKDTLREV